MIKGVGTDLVEKKRVEIIPKKNPIIDVIKPTIEANLNGSTENPVTCFKKTATDWLKL